MISFIEFEKLANEICRRWISDETSERQFKILGINPNDWPKSKARDILLDYLAHKSSSGDRASRFFYNQQISNEPYADIPEDGESLLEYYSVRLKEIRYHSLGHKLQSNPKKGDFILSTFHKDLCSNIKHSSVSADIFETISNMENLIESNIAELTIKGWERLSIGIGGFNSQRVSMLVAGTGIGKTTLAVNLAMSARDTGQNVIFINMEMSKHDMMMRFIQCRTGLTVRTWKDQFTHKMPLIDKLQNDLNQNKKIIYTHGDVLGLDQIINFIYLYTESEPRSFVFIDYDQKIKIDNRSEEWKQLQSAIETLEQCAKKTDCHIMILAQGDENGLPKASKRSMQAASTVLHFTKEDDQFVIKAIKNRFGAHDLKVYVNYKPETAFIEECEKIITPYKGWCK